MPISIEFWEKMKNKSYDTQLELLLNFVNKYSYLAEQGTQEWLEERKYTIGGSEMSIMTGTSKFASIEELIFRKIGVEKFEGSLATRWGRLFEPVSQKITNLFFNPESKIYETGSVQGNIKGHKYSPDGLAVIKFKKKNDEFLNLITLLEFKSPFSSIPNNKIPEYYYPQVFAGLSSLGLPQIGLFVNSMFRKCSLENIKSNTYDTIFHKSDTKKISSSDPLAYGIILFYINDQGFHTIMNKYLDNLNEFREIEKLQNMSDEKNTSHDNDLYKKNNTKKFHNKNIDDIFDDISISSSDGDNYTNTSNIVENIEDKFNTLFKDDIINILYKNLTDYNKKNNNKNTRNKKNNQKKILDFGISNRKLMDELFLLIQDGIVKIKYTEPSILIEYDIIETKFKEQLIIPNELKCNFENRIFKKYDYLKIIKKFNNICKNRNDTLIGYLPWKLMKSSNILVEPDMNFPKQVNKRIKATIITIKKITNNYKIKDKGVIIDNLIQLFDNPKYQKVMEILKLDLKKIYKIKTNYFNKINEDKILNELLNDLEI